MVTVLWTTFIHYTIHTARFRVTLLMMLLLSRNQIAPNYRVSAIFCDIAY